MKNMSSIIEEFNEERSCSCRNKECCPLEGYFLRQCMKWEAKVTTENDFKLYYGTCGGEFESRFYNHAKSFRDRANKTKLLKYV